MDSTGALLTKSPRTEIAHGTQWCLLILICSHSGEGGLWFQNNGPIPKDQNQICFAILYNNIYQKHCLWQRETLPQCKAALLIDLSSVQAMTSAWIPCPKNDILCFPQGQLLYFYFLFKPPHPKQNALPSSPAPPFGHTSVFASSWPHGCLPQDVWILPTTSLMAPSHSPLAPTTHMLQKTLTHQFHEDRDHFWYYPPAPTAGPGTQQS